MPQGRGAAKSQKPATPKRGPLRLLKVTVQPTFVGEDEKGELVEISTAPQNVTAANWPGYARGQFQELQELARKAWREGQEQGG